MQTVDDSKTFLQYQSLMRILVSNFSDGIHVKAENLVERSNML